MNDRFITFHFKLIIVIIYFFNTVPRLPMKVSEIPLLTTNTDMVVYQDCVMITLLHGSETWTLYTQQQHLPQRL